VIFRYVQRLDGFVSLDFDPAGGQATTAPVVVTGSYLMLNLDTAALGQLRVELQDAQGQPIPGFGLEDCSVLRTNDTRAIATWKGGSDLSSLSGHEIRLVFSGAKAKLFSFLFGDAPSPP